MLQTIREDMYRYSGIKKPSFFRRLRYATSLGCRTMWIIRHYQASTNSLIKIFWKILRGIEMNFSGMQIPMNVKIGRGCKILHFGNIVISPDAVIGDNFTIAEGCCIGASFINGKAGAPTIGNDVCMFANSIVVGG